MKKHFTSSEEREEQSTVVVATFGVPLEMCPMSSNNKVRVDGRVPCLGSESSKYPDRQIDCLISLLVHFIFKKLHFIPNYCYFVVVIIIY